MNGLLGKKVGMTQVFTEKGDCVCVTVIQVEGCVPVLKRTQSPFSVNTWVIPTFFPNIVFIEILIIV